MIPDGNIIIDLSTCGACEKYKNILENNLLVYNELRDVARSYEKEARKEFTEEACKGLDEWITITIYGANAHPVLELSRQLTADICAIEKYLQVLSTAIASSLVIDLGRQHLFTIITKDSLNNSLYKTFSDFMETMNEIKKVSDNK